PMTSRHGASWGSGGRGFKSPLPDQTSFPSQRIGGDETDPDRVSSDHASRIRTGTPIRPRTHRSAEYGSRVAAGARRGNDASRGTRVFGGRHPQRGRPPGAAAVRVP